MTIPQQTIESGFEDTQSIDDDLNTLYSKFIQPLESLRSISTTISSWFDSNLDKNLVKTIQQNLTVENTPQESRGSCFYRYLGFPVVSKSSSNYSSGFNPLATSANIESINTSQDPANRKLIQTRETHAQFIRDLLNNQDLTASLFALVIGLHPKPFNNLDNQNFKVIGRSEEIDLIAKDNPTLADQISAARDSVSNTALTSNFDSGHHNIFPFSIDPVLNMTVQPSNFLIAASFLPDQAATTSSSDPQVVHLRPGIEFIVRIRLQNLTPDTKLLQTFQNILSQEKNPSSSFVSNADNNSLRDTLFALSDQNNITSLNLDQIFSGFSTVQTQIVTDLINTIKVTVLQLREQVSELERVRTKINFIPVLNLDSKNGVYGSVRDGAATTQLDSQILQLTIKKLNAETQAQFNQNLGKFATPFLNLEKTDTYTDQLQQLTQQKQDLGTAGINALRNIEIITGEISGLGLVDILAIYTALFSIDIQDLLGLLDQDALARISQFNPDLDVGPIVLNTPQTPTLTALDNLKTRLSNILSFADKLYTDSLQSPQENQAGSI